LLQISTLLHDIRMKKDDEKSWVSRYFFFRHLGFLREVVALFLGDLLGIHSNGVCCFWCSKVRKPILLVYELRIGGA